MKLIFPIAILCLLMMACGGILPGTNTNTVTTTNTNVSAANTPGSTNTTNANANTANANASTPKPVDNGPKRISFGKGQTTGSENVMLAPGESKKFVVGVAEGQFLSIESSAKEATISMLTKGKTTDVTEEDGLYNATTTAKGDIVFQITNGTKKPFKSSIRVSIDFQGE